MTNSNEFQQAAAQIFDDAVASGLTPREAAAVIRRGSNDAALQRVEYRLPPPAEWIHHNKVLGPIFCGGVDEAWAVDIEAGDFRPEPRLKPVQPDLMTVEGHLKELACIALRHAEEWLACHAVRAGVRHLELSRDICLRVGSIVRSMRRQTEERGAVSTSTCWLVVRLYDCVVEIAIQASGLSAAISAIAEVVANVSDFRSGWLDDLTAIRGATAAVGRGWDAPETERECLDA
jgi:hypothetical protein